MGLTLINSSPGFSSEHLIWACILGAISAVSLPLGSSLGLLVTPKPKVTASLTAFGGGALFCALAIELVAPTAAALTGDGHHGGHGDPRQAMYALIFGMIAGGLLFFFLDQMVNAKGGFLRKTATSVAYLGMRKKQRDEIILKQLSSVGVLRQVPASGIRKLVSLVRPRTFEDGQVLFEQGDIGDVLYFIVEGSVALEEKGKHFKDLEAGTVVGEIALLTGAPRTATAKAKGRVQTLSLHKQDFETLRQEFSELDNEARHLAQTRMTELKDRHKAEADEALRWMEDAKDALKMGVELPTSGELRKAKEEHSGAPLAIWLGILLDGVPESFVIGATLLGFLSTFAGDPTLAQVIPYTLIAGLFLSNFPEAMSSSIGMRTQGWSKKRILSMWMVLMVVTSIGAGVGYAAGEYLDHTLLVAIEGLAAGAMLTMIASAMIPEAVHLGGSSVAGLSTLVGFLAAVAFKMLE